MSEVAHAGLGISLKYGDDWRRDLGMLGHVGFCGFELPADKLGAIAAGHLDRDRLTDIIATFAAFPYWYTLHAPAALNLRDASERTWQRDLLHSTIRLAGALNASRLVVHFEGKSDLPEVEQQMIDLLAEAAQLAREEGVLLCIENIEIERVQPVLQCIRELDHSNVRMTFDVGHAWLASKHFGFDFFEALSAAAPYIAHLHVSDNFGRFETTRLSDFGRYKLMSFTDLLMLGKGDLHLPVGYGSIPYREIFRQLHGFAGSLVMECRFGKYPGEIDRIFAMLRERAALMNPPTDHSHPTDTGNA